MRLVECRVFALDLIRAEGYVRVEFITESRAMRNNAKEGSMFINVNDHGIFPNGVFSA